MNPSRIFILRPVATSLLMMAIMLVGIVAFQFLPSRCRRCPRSPIRPSRFRPSIPAPARMLDDLGGDRALGAAIRPDAEPEPDVVDQFGGRFDPDAAIQPRHLARRGGAGGPGGDQRRRQPAARRSAGSADLRQGQSRRRAGSDVGRHVANDAVDRRRRPGGHPHRAKNIATARRRRRQHQRWYAQGRARAGQPRKRWRPTGSTNLDDLRTTISNANVNQLQGQLRRPDARLYHQRQRPASQRRRV